MNTPGVARRSVMVIATLALMLTIAGCAPASNGADGKSAATKRSATPTPTPTPTPSPTPTASSGAEPASTAPTCDTALLPAATADFASTGLVPKKFTAWRTSLDFMTDGGGIACRWGGGGDVEVIFGQLALSQADWDAKRAELIRTGFVEQATPAGYFNEPDTDENYNDGGFVYRDGQLYYMSYPGVSVWVPGLA